MNCPFCGANVTDFTRLNHDCPALPVIDALNRLEDIDGPQGNDYTNVMRAIAAEAQRRADRFERLRSIAQKPRRHYLTRCWCQKGT